MSEQRVSRPQVRARVWTAVCVAMAVTWSNARAQPAKPYEPKEYQEGKDVVWVPTPQTLVDRCSTWPKLCPATP